MPNPNFTSKAIPNHGVTKKRLSQSFETASSDKSLETLILYQYRFSHPNFFQSRHLSFCITRDDKIHILWLQVFISQLKMLFFCIVSDEFNFACCIISRQIVSTD